MKRFWRLLCLFILLLILPLGVFSLAVHTEENPYHNSFTASLVDKYERLSTVSAPRLVLIGGSSLPFGVNSGTLEKALGLPVVNFGVYAALGTRVMAEIALPQIRAGDLILLAPELDAQTYSDYFNPDILWEASCEKPSLLKGLTLSEKEEMLFRWFKFAIGRKKLEGESIPEGTLYARSSFDSFGDIHFEREENIMPGGFDASQPVTLEGLQNDAFFDFVLQFIRQAEKKRARVYFTFSPINQAAAVYSSDAAKALESYLSDRLGSHLLGTLADTTYEASLFYNTNYHLNEEGAALHTKTLIRLLKEAGVDPATDPSAPDDETPPVTQSEAVPSSEPSSSVLPYDPNERFVVIREIGGNLFVTGLSEEGKAQESLTLPESYEGRPVIGLSSDSLTSDVLARLVIPGSYRFFDSYIFDGSPRLARIILYLEDPSSSSIPMQGLFDGCDPSLAVYVPDESLAAYLSDYNWRIYRSCLKRLSDLPQED